MMFYGGQLLFSGKQQGAEKMMPQNTLRALGIQRRAVAYPEDIYTIVAGKVCETSLSDGHDNGRTYYRGDSIIVLRQTM